MRDVLIPASGIFIAVYALVSETFEPWMLPLIAGLCGVPLVARGGPPDEEGES